MNILIILLLLFIILYIYNNIKQFDIYAYNSILNEAHDEYFEFKKNYNYICNYNKLNSDILGNIDELNSIYNKISINHVKISNLSYSNKKELELQIDKIRLFIFDIKMQEDCINKYLLYIKMLA